MSNTTLRLLVLLLAMLMLALFLSSFQEFAVIPAFIAGNITGILDERRKHRP